MPDLFLVKQHQVEKPQTEMESPGAPCLDSETWVATTLPDATERTQALDIRASWIVEAPAGSGKTGLLIQRYLKLLADESVGSPEQVLAITFTKKATAEMRERVLAQLQSAADQATPANAFDLATRPLAVAALARDRALNWQLLDQPARLNIRTIDSVCSDIASSLPLLSGSGGRRTTVEDAEPLYLTAARRTFMQLGDAADPALNEALRLVLLHRDGNLPECERLLAGMLEHREQWGEFIPVGNQRLDDAWLDATVLPKLELALEQTICTALTQLAKTIPAATLTQLTTAASEMAHIEGYNGLVSPIAICAGRHSAPKETSEDLAHWRAIIHLLVTAESKWRKRFQKNDVKFLLGKPDGAALSAIVESVRHNDELLRLIQRLNCLPPAKYPQEQWVVAKALFRILNRALAELQVVFAERSECDFAELALAARTALRHDDGTRDLESASSIHLQHLLVDEMQDTSSSQYELIQMLTNGWDGHSQTVFLVGDPKQSIYLFRQARVERFLRTMRAQHLGDLPLGVLRLTANFRSQATLVTEFNADFEAIFPSTSSVQHPGQVPFVTASPIRPADSSISGRAWHPTIVPTIDPVTDARSKKHQHKIEASEIRRIVEHWQTKPLPLNRKEPWKIAVLVRSRNHLDDIVAEFKANSPLTVRHLDRATSPQMRHLDRAIPYQMRHLDRATRAERPPHFVLTPSDSTAHPPIPYRAVDIEPLKTRPEIQDLYALTRALLHPADRTAWLAVLRAPWCGLSLADLHLLTGADDPAFSRRTFMHLLAERGDLLSPDTLIRLERIWPILKAATDAIDRQPLAQTVERTWRSLGGDTYLTASELTNSRRYLQLLDDLETDSTTFQLSALERRLTRLYAAPILHPGAVDLLTMHKAKGLEWDVVIVPALERIAGRNRSRLLTWIELDPTSPHDEAAHVLLAPIAGKGEDSAELNKWIASIHNAREAAERKRLFYVACTRAREELHLFASPSLSGKGEIQRKTGSLLESAWPAAEPHFANTLASASSINHALQEDEDTGLAIAASASGAPAERPATLQRLPIAFDPTSRLRSSRPLYTAMREGVPAAPHFERPEGSVAARAFGNAVHAFLERMTQQIAAGTSAANILNALPTWPPRIAAILRAEGLQPAMVERLTQRVLHALSATLKDPQGLWLLSPHEGAFTEYALTAWSTQRTAIRVDRVFRAGPEPLEAGPASGQDHLWIVDYKTTTHGPEGLDAFLTAERAKYAPQLETYAAVLQQPKAEQKQAEPTEDEPQIRLALYYPMLSKLLWWPR